jgi:hypothetical protein
MNLVSGRSESFSELRLLIGLQFHNLTRSILKYRVSSHASMEELSAHKTSPEMATTGLLTISKNPSKIQLAITVLSRRIGTTITPVIVATEETHTVVLLVDPKTVLYSSAALPLPPRRRLSLTKPLLRTAQLCPTYRYSQAADEESARRRMQGSHFMYYTGNKKEPRLTPFPLPNSTALDPSIVV